MSTIFDKLEIDGSFISELSVVPSKELRMHLFQGPRTNSGKEVVEEHDVLFTRLHGYSFNIKAEPWLEILSHTISSESNYLTDYLTRKTDRKVRKSQSENNAILHFQIVCDEGSIDILAEGVSLSLTNAIPFFDFNVIKEEEKRDTDINMTRERQTEIEIRCSFCDRVQHEVSRIIVGAKANICNECTATCADLLTQ
jgi:hypothetical protein